jgi:hypothetical protein
MGHHPLHSSSCRTWIYQWNCPECSDQVFVFECTCGSWVMFNDVNSDWHKHRCFDRQYQRLVERVLPIIKEGSDPKAATFQPFADLKEAFSELAPGPDGSTRPPPRRQNSPQVNRKDEHTIKRMDPFDGELVTLVGVVRELAKGTDRQRELYGKLGNLGLQLLNLPPASRAVALTIFESSDEPNESYTCIADNRSLEKSIKPGVMVWVRLAGHATKGVSVWVVEEIHPI